MKFFRFFLVYFINNALLLHSMEFIQVEPDALATSLNTFFDHPVMQPLYKTYGVAHLPLLSKLQTLCSQPHNIVNHKLATTCINNASALQKIFAQKKKYIVTPGIVQNFKELSEGFLLARIPSSDGYYLYDRFALFKDHILEQQYVIHDGNPAEDAPFCLALGGLIACMNSAINNHHIIIFKWQNNNKQVINLPTFHTITLLKSADSIQSPTSRINAVTGNIVHSIDVVTGERQHCFIAHAHQIISMELANDGMFATGDCDSCVHIWDMRISQPVIQKRIPSTVTLAWSCTGDFLATGNNSGKILLWDVRNMMNELCELSLQDAPSSPIQTVTFHQQGEFLAASTVADPTIQIFNLAQQRCVKEIRSTSDTQHPLPLGKNLQFSLSGNELFADWGTGIKIFSFSEDTRQQLSHDESSYTSSMVHFSLFNIGHILLSAYKHQQSAHAKLLEEHPDHPIHQLYSTIDKELN